MTHEYDDIINLPHRKSKYRKQMSMHDRAAQFAPFAALTGYDSAVKETARLTNERVELSDEEVERLNLKIQIMIDNIEQRPSVEVLYFVPDLKKSGGEYVSFCGNIRAVDTVRQQLIFEGEKKIFIGDVAAVFGDIFANYFLECEF